jgi:hypothetical protein
MTHGELRDLLAEVPEENATAWVIEQLRGINSEAAFDDDVSLVEFRFP